MALDRLVVSGVAGSVSLACWIIVFTPQLYENWHRKSAEGLSLSFVVIWLLGDLFNVIGAVLQHVLPTMVVLAAYYTAADLVLLWQCQAYGTAARPRDAEHAEREPLLENTNAVDYTVEHYVKNQPHSQLIKNTLIVLVVLLCGVAGYLVEDHTPDPSPPGAQPVSVVGQVFGWVCALLYLASRVPQLKLNYDRKSTDGVAVLFFVFTLLGNITYCVSIFAADSSKHAMLINASWILGAAGSLLLDVAVLGQFWYYRK